MKFNDPTPKYTTQPNGDITVEWLPPTALMMTAHREIEKFQEILGGQGRTIQTMQAHINYLETHINNLEGIINELKTPKSSDGSGTDPGSTNAASPSVRESTSTGN